MWRKNKVAEKLDNNSREEMGIMEERAMRYLEASLDVLETSALITGNFIEIFKDDKKIKSLAIEYKLLNLLIQAKEKMQTSQQTPENTIHYIKGIILNIQQNRNMFRVVEQELIVLIKDLNILEMIFSLIKEPNKFRLNLDFVLVNIEKLSLEKLRFALKNEILLLKNQLEESNTLQIAINDINNWHLLPNQGVEFYLTRINSYFEPNLEHKGFIGLDTFNDIELKKKIFESRPIGYLKAIAHLTYKVEAQMEFLRSLIKFIENDISGDVWVQNKYTKIFLDDVPKNSSILVETYKNKYLAKLLEKKSKQIGEQPFELIKMLQEMMGIIDAAAKKKEYAISRSKEFLAYSFNERKTELLNNAQEQIKKFSISGLLKYLDLSLNEVMKKISRFVDNLWKARKRQFNQFFTKIKDLHAKLEPAVNDIIEKGLIDRDFNKFMLKIKALNDFRTHKRMLFEKISSGKNLFPYLLMLDFDLARMRDIFLDLKKHEKDIKVKSEYLTNAVKTITSDMDMLIKIDINFIDFITFISLNVEQINLRKARELFVSFGGVFNG